MIKMYVSKSFKKSVFVLKNILPLRVEQSIGMILHPKWTSHFVSYTEFGHTLRHERNTLNDMKIGQALS